VAAQNTKKIEEKKTKNKSSLTKLFLKNNRQISMTVNTKYSQSNGSKQKQVEKRNKAI